MTAGAIDAFLAELADRVADRVLERLQGLQVSAGAGQADDAALSEREAAAFLGVSVPTVCRLRKSGEIGYSLIKRRVVYSRAELEAFRARTSVEAVRGRA